MGVCVWSYFHFFHANLVHRNIGWVPYFSFTEKIWRMSDLELWNVSFFLENVESKKGFKQEENKLGVSSVCLSLCLPNHIQTSSNYDYWTWWLLGVLSKKKHSTFKDIVQIGGREVNPISKNWKKMIFWQKLEREGVTKHIVKNRSTLFCMIYYSIWPNQGTLCLSVCTPDPQKVIRIIENVNSKPKMSCFLSKILGEGGREVNMINTLSEINLSKIGLEGGGSTSIWIMCLNILFVFLKVPLIRDRSCSYLICHLVPTILPAYLQYILCQCFPM